MTDWWAFSELKDEVYAGSDVKMPEMITLKWDKADTSFDLVKELDTGDFNKEVCINSVRRILRMFEKLD